MDPGFKEGNVNDLVYTIIAPVLDSFKQMTGRTSIRLRREKNVTAVDGETGGTEEFIMMDLVSLREEKFVLIVEAKRTSLGQATKQCFLAMKDMADRNGDDSIMYGFITTGESWRMVQYDGTSFKMTCRIDVLYQRMAQEKEKAIWMKDHSVLVDCIYAALNHGGRAGTTHS